MQKNIVLKINALWFLKFHGFHGKPLWDCKKWGYMYKNTYILIVSHPRLLNMVPNKSLDVAV